MASVTFQPVPAESSSKGLQGDSCASTTEPESERLGGPHYTQSSAFASSTQYGSTRLGAGAGASPSRMRRTMPALGGHPGASPLGRKGNADQTRRQWVSGAPFGAEQTHRTPKATRGMHASR